MLDAIPDLWPAYFGETDVNPPVVILREQGAFLGQQLKNRIKGSVKSTDSGEKLRHDFYIVVPPLGNYHYRLFAVQHDIGFYPLVISQYKDMNEIKCQTEEEFVAALRDVLNSEWTHRVIACLAAQIEAPPKRKAERSS